MATRDDAGLYPPGLLSPTLHRATRNEVFKKKGDGGLFLFSLPRAAAFVALTLPRPVTVYDVATKKQVKVIQLEQGLAPKRMQVVSAPKSTTEN